MIPPDSSTSEPKTRQPTTRLQAFLDANGIPAARLEAAAGMSRQHLRRIRLGQDIRLSTARRILHALRRITGRKVAVEEIFDFDSEESVAA